MTTEDRIAAIEAQLQKLFTYIGTSDGDLFATSSSVIRLERIIAQQQVQISQLQQTLQTTQDILAQQFQSTVSKTKSPEFTMLTKFVATHTADVLNKLQTNNRQILQEFFDNLPSPNKLGPQKHSQTSNGTLEQKMHMFATRLALLEINQSPQICSTDQLQIQNHPTTHPDTVLEDIQTLKDHIRHVENELLTQITLHYTGPNKQQPVIHSVKALQADLQAVQQEIQTIRVRQHEKVCQEEIYNVLMAQIRNYTNQTSTQFQTSLEHRIADCAKSSEMQQQIISLERQIDGSHATLQTSLAHTATRLTTALDAIQHKFDALTFGDDLKVIDHRLTTDILGVTQRIARLETVYTTRLQHILHSFEHPSILQKKPELTALLDNAKAELSKPLNQGHTHPHPHHLSTQDLRYNGLTKCFYTAVFTDGLHTPDTLGKGEKIPGWDYICLTNCPTLESSVWQITHVDGQEKTAVLNAKHIKWNSAHINALHDYDVVVWVDAYLLPSARAADRLKQTIVDMWNQELMILHRPHKERNCVWKECDAVLASKRDTPEHVAAVKRILDAIDMPRTWGLFDSNLLVKFQKYDALQRVSQHILSQLRTVSPRDQLAITPVYYTQQFNKFYTKDIMEMFVKAGIHERHPAF
jgi:hypothetical protein